MYSLFWVKEDARDVVWCGREGVKGSVCVGGGGGGGEGGEGGEEGVGGGRKGKQSPGTARETVRKSGNSRLKIAWGGVFHTPGCAYSHIYLKICIHTYINTYIYTTRHRHTDIHTYIQKYTYPYLHTYIRTRVKRSVSLSYERCVVLNNFDGCENMVVVSTEKCESN